MTVETQTRSVPAGFSINKKPRHNVDISAKSQPEDRPKGNMFGGTAFPQEDCPGVGRGWIYKPEINDYVENPDATQDPKLT